MCEALLGAFEGALADIFGERRLRDWASGESRDTGSSSTGARRDPAIDAPALSDLKRGDIALDLRSSPTSVGALSDCAASVGVLLAFPLGCNGHQKPA